MIVCSCFGVTDRAIRDAIAAGAGAVEELADACCAGRTCGGCTPELVRLLGQRQDATTTAQILTSAH